MLKFHHSKVGIDILQRHDVRPHNTQSLILIRRHEWSGRIASFPLLCVSLSVSFFLLYLARPQVAPADASSPMYASYTCFEPRMCLLGLVNSIFTLLPIFYQNCQREWERSTWWYSNMEIRIWSQVFEVGYRKYKSNVQLQCER